MKKLMIAAAIVCVAVVSQAASFSWTLETGKIYDGSNSRTLLGSGTAYLINGDVTSQQALLTAAMGDSFDIANYAIAGSGSAISAGVVAGSKAFDYSASASFQAYYAIVADGKIFISDAVASGYQESSTQIVSFPTSPAKTSNNLPIEGGTFSTANSWYATAVPEPTSGLLLLLGVAGLALRRRA